MTKENKLHELVSSFFKAELEEKIKTKLQEELDVKAIIDRITVENFMSLHQTIVDIVKETCLQIVPDIIEEKAFSDDIRSFLTDEIHKEMDTRFDNEKLTAILEKEVLQFLNAQTPDTLFANSKIGHRLVDFSEFRISPGLIEPGIFKNFSSTGIEDIATNCQLTITDEFIAIENGIVSPKIEATTKLFVHGDAEFRGNVLFSEAALDTLTKASLAKLFTNHNEQFMGKVNKALEESFLNAKAILVDGTPLFKDGALSKNIIHSNLQKLGKLQELEVEGAAVFSDTVHITKGRVGVNTKAPNGVFEVWDQDVEFVVKKITKNTAYIGSDRSNSIVIGSNGKNNLVLSPDGSVSIDDLNISSIKISTSPKEPQAPGKLGDITFNSRPAENAPSGWQCLGGSRWLAFKW